MCASGDVESIEHTRKRDLDCTSVSNKHSPRWESQVPELTWLQQQLMSNASRRMELLLGVLPQFPPGTGTMKHQHNYGNGCAKALWALDKHSKNLLSRIWRKRERRIGSFWVLTEHTPPRIRSPVSNTTASQHNPSPRSVHDPALREFWKPWLKDT